MFSRPSLSRSQSFQQMSRRDGKCRYLKNAKYKSSQPYCPRFIKVEYTPSHFASLGPTNTQHLPVKTTFKGVCNYCRDLHFINMKGKDYLNHLIQVHHVYDLPPKIHVKVTPPEQTGECNLPLIECKLYGAFLKDKKPPSALRNEYHEDSLTGLDKEVVFRTKSRMQQFVEMAELESEENYDDFDEDHMKEFMEDVIFSNDIFTF